jgi:hypothetical protein
VQRTCELYTQPVQPPLTDGGRAAGVDPNLAGEGDAAAGRTRTGMGGRGWRTGSGAEMVVGGGGGVTAVAR